MFHCFIANYDNVRVISTGCRNFWWNTQLERLSFLYFWRCFEHLFENVFHLLPNSNIFALIFQFSNVFQLFLIFDNCLSDFNDRNYIDVFVFCSTRSYFLCYYHTCADQLIINCHTCDIWLLTGIIHPVTFCSTFFPFLFFVFFDTIFRFELYHAIRVLVLICFVQWKFIGHKLRKLMLSHPSCVTRTFASRAILTSFSKTNDIFHFFTSTYEILLKKKTNKRSKKIKHFKKIKKKKKHWK